MLGEELDEELGQNSLAPVTLFLIEASYSCAKHTTEETFSPKHLFVSVRAPL